MSDRYPDHIVVNGLVIERATTPAEEEQRRRARHAERQIEQFWKETQGLPLPLTDAQIAAAMSRAYRKAAKEDSR